MLFAHAHHTIIEQIQRTLSYSVARVPVACSDGEKLILQQAGGHEGPLPTSSATPAPTDNPDNLFRFIISNLIEGILHIAESKLNYSGDEQYASHFALGHSL